MSRIPKSVVILIISIIHLHLVDSQRGTIYPMTFQPEIDSLDIGVYFRNERLVKLQIMCIFYGGPCDIAGRWLKSRMIPGIFGNCPACSKHQQKMLPKWMWMFADRYPDKFRAVIAQWLMDQGFTVPSEEVPKIQKALGFRDPVNILFPRNVINATYESALQTRQFKRQPSLIDFFGRTRGGLLGH
ncbi:uncharacterized protein LOC110854348 [Folsomia candida]|uniref:Ejaculatory bulb-specific protein 3 n=1 Tax=Folsomia candida TaxID=158441 RepID=A0A226DZ10_FOLCA|nr:uncharacterized protein LOC110854348 [Folsomia candida]OXA49931.1 Ejaculatory bulb-specific protein 3 [Folsomia candida]